ncbi:MAG TPA: FAD-dependent oxidoreductase [Saprospiraceae bacterium]|nr:FAD-dependent oxidoreductase [Saprospiraceae bacterium]
MKLLLVGQGIAGTLLAWTLQKQGAQVDITDGNLHGSSSLVAAGIINPVTGKRFVKSWRFDDFFPAAKTAYQALEHELNIRIWSEQPIVRLLSTPEEVNNWSARCALPDYEAHLSESDDAGDWAGFVKPGFQYGLIRRAARVDFPALISAFRQKAIAGGFFGETNMDYETAGRLTNEYDGIIFCEGYRGQENPFFPGLPWQLAKGEALLLRLQHEQAPTIDQMLKKTMTLVPVGENLFWAGGSYQWHYPDLLPSEQELQFIMNHLSEMLAAPFEIVGQVAGVRPTVKDRRPFLGQSSINSKVFIFNGLGTKGALLAPYWAEHFSSYLLEGSPLDKDVDIRRFTI